MSILFDEKELRNLDHHQLNKRAQKNLDTLSQNVTIKNGPIPKLQIYQQNYNKLQEQLQRQTYEEIKYLKPDKYESIFGDVPTYNQGNDQLKQFYYNEFIQKPQIEEQRQQQRVLEKENQQVIIYGLIEKTKQTNPFIRDDKKQKIQELNQLKKEIKLIQIQNERRHQQSNVKEPKQICRNPKVISKLSSCLLSIYNVYFKEISDELIDDILLDEIQYLNDTELLEKDEHSEQQQQELAIEEPNDLDQDDFDMKLKQVLSQLNDLAD